MTVADIALFAYTHRADEAGLSLDVYRYIREWIGRIKDTPGYVPMLKGS